MLHPVDRALRKETLRKGRHHNSLGDSDVKAQGKKSTNARITFAHTIKEHALGVLGSSGHNFYRKQTYCCSVTAQTGACHFQALQGALPFQEHCCEMEIIYTYKFYLRNTHPVQRSCL